MTARRSNQIKIGSKICYFGYKMCYIFETMIVNMDQALDKQNFILAARFYWISFFTESVITLLLTILKLPISTQIFKGTDINGAKVCI